jgi:hypothetical protein
LLDEKLAQTLPTLKNEILEELNICGDGLTEIQNKL